MRRLQLGATAFALFAIAAVGTASAEDVAAHGAIAVDPAVKPAAEMPAKPKKDEKLPVEHGKKDPISGHADDTHDMPRGGRGDEQQKRGDEQRPRGGRGDEQHKRGDERVQRGGRGDEQHKRGDEQGQRGDEQGPRGDDRDEQGPRSGEHRRHGERRPPFGFGAACGVVGAVLGAAAAVVVMRRRAAKAQSVYEKVHTKEVAVNEV